MHNFEDLANTLNPMEPLETVLGAVTNTAHNFGLEYVYVNSTTRGAMWLELLSAGLVPSVEMLRGVGFFKAYEELSISNTFYKKTVEEMAVDLRKEVGGNSISFKTAKKSGQIDLAGKPHYDKSTDTSIPTSHIQTYGTHAGPIGKLVFLESLEQLFRRQNLIFA